VEAERWARCKQRYVGLKYPPLHNMAYRIEAKSENRAISCRPRPFRASWRSYGERCVGVGRYCPTIERMAGQEQGGRGRGPVVVVVAVAAEGW
jgi:hypothetical protein